MLCIHFHSDTSRWRVSYARILAKYVTKFSLLICWLKFSHVKTGLLILKLGTNGQDLYLYEGVFRAYRLLWGLIVHTAN